MPLVVNSNIASLNAQRQLLQSGADLDQASERLASGKRINTAADDAAGLAISNRQTSQIRGLDQAVRNANDGISLIQTAEGALDETTNILQRMRELSIQSANGIYSDADRATLDAEVQQLKDEIDRIAETTSFNGQSILDGTLEDVALQVGSDANQTITFGLDGFDTSSLGGIGGDIIGQESGGLTSLTGLDGDDLVINDITISSLTAQVGETLNTILGQINGELEGKGAEVTTLVTAEASGIGDGQLVAGDDTLQIDVVDGDGNTQSYVITDTKNLDELVDKLNSETALTASLSDDGNLTLSQDGVVSITVTDSTGAGGASGFGAGAQATNFALVVNDTDGNGVVVEAGTGAELTAGGEIEDLGINIQDSEGNVVGQANTTVAAAALNEGDLIINGVEIGAIEIGTTADGAANAAEGQIDFAIEAINAKSAETGVVAFETAGRRWRRLESAFSQW